MQRRRSPPNGADTHRRSRRHDTHGLRGGGRSGWGRGRSRAHSRGTHPTRWRSPGRWRPEACGSTRGRGEVARDASILRPWDTRSSLAMGARSPPVVSRDDRCAVIASATERASDTCTRSGVRVLVVPWIVARLLVGGCIGLLCRRPPADGAREWARDDHDRATGASGAGPSASVLQDPRGSPPPHRRGVTSRAP